VEEEKEKSSGIGGSLGGLFRGARTPFVMNTAVDDDNDDAGEEYVEEEGDEEDYDDDDFGWGSDEEDDKICPRRMKEMLRKMIPQTLFQMTPQKKSYLNPLPVPRSRTYLRQNLTNSKKSWMRRVKR
jgi:hypothetical protein